jgi:hypothetical protein
LNGNRSATLTVARTDGGTPLTASLTGVGLEAIIVLAPTSVAFGVVCTDCGNRPPMRQIKLSNTGNATLTIRGIASSAPKIFAVSSKCGTTVDPGTTCVFSVTFNLIRNDQQATITIDADSGGQHTLAVSATGRNG